MIEPKTHNVFAVLKSCPFCRSHYASVINDGDTLKIECQNCFASGPSFEVGGESWPTAEDATRAAAQHWNERRS